MYKKAFITIGLVLSFAFISYAHIPQYINYQGILTDASGNLLTGNYTINFRIYSASSGGSLLWGPQTHTVNAQDGIFSVVLGPIDYSVFNGDERWLSIQVGTDTEMIPRKRLLSVSYSFRAHKAQDAEKLGGKNPSDYVQTSALPQIVSSVDGVFNNGGNIDLVGGSGINITPDDANNKITIKATSTGGDNLGNHTATQNIKLNGHWLSNDGGNEGIKVTNSGNVNASGNIVANNHLWATNGPVVAENSHIRTGLTQPGFVGNGDIYARQDLIAGNGYVRAGSPTSSYGVGDVAATDDVVADDDVIARDGVYGYGNTGSYGVYGKRGSRWGALGGSSYGVLGTSGSGAPYGYLGQSSYGATGTRGSRWGALGGSGYGAYGTNGSNYGYLGHNSWGAYGKNGTRSGYLGGGSYGVYGANGSRYGYLGGSSRGAQGYYNNSHWGYIGGSTYGAEFVGNVRVIGTLSKSAGAFEIDHPLDPANKYLRHSFVESADMMNIYNGNVKLDMNGEAWVDLPDWYQALNKDHRYQLTSVGAPGPNLYIAEKISNNRFKIAGGTPGMEVSWQVTGVRQDAYAKAHRIQVEVEKKGKERGKYINPEEHGVPAAMGINYDELMEMEKQIALIKEQAQIVEAEHKKMQDEKKRDEKERELN